MSDLHATLGEAAILYSAIIREMTKQGKDAQLAKSSKFAAKLRRRTPRRRQQTHGRAERLPAQADF